MKRSMPGQKLRQFFLFTYQNDRKNPGFYYLRVHLYFAHGKMALKRFKNYLRASRQWFSY
jgi:hypothetical protein